MFILNHQLFAEAYLNDLRQAKISPEIPDACRQTIAEWRAEFPDLANSASLQAYIGYSLSALKFSYAPEDEGFFFLYADPSLERPLGICLTVANDDIGRTTRGMHYQVRLVKLLRKHDLSWGIMTNGSDWRLVHAKAAAIYEVYLQANLDSLLDRKNLPHFILFYRFFNREAFVYQDDRQGVSSQMLDRMLEDSEVRTHEIERHLKGRVEPVLQALCLGFVADESNGDLDREQLDEIYQNALYLLYRILFLFYAEARGLLPTDHTGYQEVSLASIVQDAYQWKTAGAQNGDPFAYWKRLTNLCVIVDDGDESLGVRPYNGGLFSDTEKPYLRDHKMRNEYLAPALFDLAYMDTRNGSQRINYRDLSVRHLGTLYEGMLEYKLNLVRDEPVVVRETKSKRSYIPQSAAGAIKKNETILPVGQVYFADDKGERKSSGSYYTPEDVVQYIVRETLLPKLEERAQPVKGIIAEARKQRSIAVTASERAAAEGYADRRIMEIVEKDILSLKVLDPAMGSAHFLVAAGQMITNFIVELLDEVDWTNEAIATEPLLWKRRVVERCLYGVDLNPLAHELAKLALWLTSASPGKPLTFLDHHLRVGNSLYGAPLAQLTSLPSDSANEKETQQDDDIFRHGFQNALREMLAELQRITSSDSDEIDDVKMKGEAHFNARALSRRLRDVANVWLATLFGLNDVLDEPLTTGKYFDLLQLALKPRSFEEWERIVFSKPIFQEARRFAEGNHFFHWELEFSDTVDVDQCHFDAIVANPPYVGLSPNTSIKHLYKTADCGDLYAWICEKALAILASKGRLGVVVPLSITFAKSLAPLRELILSQGGDHYLSSYDNIPDCLFNTVSYGGDSKNKSMQRATIILLENSPNESSVFSTGLLKWWSKERPNLFKKLEYGNITDHCSVENFPRIGNPVLNSFWGRLKKSVRLDFE